MCFFSSYSSSSCLGFLVTREISFDFDIYTPLSFCCNILYSSRYSLVISVGIMKEIVNHCMINVFTACCFYRVCVLTAVLFLLT
jgi:hypothetical protein